MTGLLGFASGYRAMEHCEVLLMLGTDFPYRRFLPEHARVIQVDVRGEHIGWRIPVDIALVGTVRGRSPRCSPGWPTAATRRTWPGCSRTMVALASGSTRWPRRILTAARSIPKSRLPPWTGVAAEDAVFLADAGTPTLWAARYLRLNGHRRLVGSFNHGSMANAQPEAIGVQAWHPGRQVVTLSGDGGLSMLMGEQITLRRRRLPVKVVVLSNAALTFVELEMKADGIPTYGTDLDNPSFPEVARAVGLYGVRIEQPGELDDALRAAFAHDGPAVIEVMTVRQELLIRPKITAEQAKGFTLWATRSVLPGWGDEVLEVAKTNLRELALE